MLSGWMDVTHWDRTCEAPECSRQASLIFHGVPLCSEDYDAVVKRLEQRGIDRYEFKGDVRQVLRGQD